MNPSSEAAPFDILPIPYFPYELSLFEWMVVAAGLIMIILLSVFIRHKRSRSPHFPLFSLLYNELVRARSLLGTSPSEAVLRQLAADTSMAVRRALSLYESQDFIACSERELRALGAQPVRSEIKAITDFLIELERVRYSPHPNGVTLALTIDDLQSQLRNYELSRSATQ